MYLIAALIFIVGLKWIGMLVTSKYPKTNCALVQQQYGAKLQDYAYIEHSNFYKTDKDAQMTGVL